MIKLTILVADIDAAILLYTHIKLYTSDDESGTYTHLAYVALVADQSTYYYDDVDGTEDTWYKSSYYNMNSGLESTLSDAVQGIYAELFHYPTYPSEIDFSSDEKVIIRKIRRLIGDLKDLDRIYITDTSDELNYLIQNDDKTVKFNEDRGWPVYITVAGVEKTTTSDPIVQGYRWTSFSGTLGDGSYPIDIWYHVFKFSDREIIEAYNDSQMPPFVNNTTVNQDMIIIQSAIDLLENMWSQDSVEDGSNVRDDSSTYSPSPGLLERSKILANLKKQLDTLVKQYIMSGLTGVLID